MLVVVSIVFFLSGVFAWTLGEYVIHRFVMHQVEGRSMPSREHLMHHATGGESTRRGYSLIVPPASPGPATGGGHWLTCSSLLSKGRVDMRRASLRKPSARSAYPH